MEKGTLRMVSLGLAGALTVTVVREGLEAAVEPTNLHVPQQEFSPLDVAMQVPMPITASGQDLNAPLSEEMRVGDASIKVTLAGEWNDWRG